MSVPKVDIVCRFVRQRDWSKAERRPKPGAFKDVELSVWHKDELLERDVKLDELRIENLAGYGQAHYAVEDFYKAAKQASKEGKCEFAVQVEWRCEDQYVEVPWRRWAYAHIQVESGGEPRRAWTAFRRILSLRARTVCPPDNE